MKEKLKARVETQQWGFISPLQQALLWREIENPHQIRPYMKKKSTSTRKFVKQKVAPRRRDTRRRRRRRISRVKP